MLKDLGKEALIRRTYLEDKGGRCPCDSLEMADIGKGEYTNNTNAQTILSLTVLVSLKNI